LVKQISLALAAIGGYCAVGADFLVVLLWGTSKKTELERVQKNTKDMHMVCSSGPFVFYALFISLKMENECWALWMVAFQLTESAWWFSNCCSIRKINQGPLFHKFWLSMANFPMSLTECATIIWIARRHIQLYLIGGNQTSMWNDLVIIFDINSYNRVKLLIGTVKIVLDPNLW